MQKQMACLSLSDPGTVPVLVDPGTEARRVPTVLRFWITDDKNCWLALIQIKNKSDRPSELSSPLPVF